MKIVGGSYNLTHRSVSVQRCLNMMPVPMEVSGGKDIAYLEQIPGLRVFSGGSGFLLHVASGYLVTTSAGGRLRLSQA